MNLIQQYRISTVLTSDRFASKPKRLLGSLIKQFDDLKKCKNKPKLFKTKCIEFDALCAKLYDIAHPQAEENIKCCRFRNAERKIEDLDFLQDQRTTRLKGIGPVDKHFSTKVSNKQKRLQAAQDFKDKQASSSSNVTPIQDSESESISTDSSSDEYVPPSSRKKMKDSESTGEAKFNLLASPEFHKAADVYKLSHRGRTALAAVAQV